MPKRSIAIALALFFGGVGVHSFYIGQPKKGILFLLFSWTFVPVIIAFIEAIRWLFMSNADFQVKYAQAHE